MIVTNYIGDPFDGENIAPGDTATGITAAKMSPLKAVPAKAAFIQVEDETINYSVEGIPATNAAGTNVRHSLLAGESILLVGAVAIRNFSCVDRVSGTTATVKVTLYR